MGGDERGGDLLRRHRRGGDAMPSSGPDVVGADVVATAEGGLVPPVTVVARERYAIATAQVEPIPDCGPFGVDGQAEGENRLGPGEGCSGSVHVERLIRPEHHEVAADVASHQ